MKKNYNTTNKPLRIISQKLKYYFKGKCLDIGSDNGRHLYLMPKRSIGLDFHEGYFSDYKRRGYIGVKCNLDKEILKFKDCTFDTILFSHCLEHINSPNKILDEIIRVLKPKGILIIGVPNAYCVHTDFYSQKWDCHINVYDGKVLKKILLKKGFTIKKRYCNFPFGWGLLYIIFNHTPLKYVWDDIFFVCKLHKNNKALPKNKK